MAYVNTRKRKSTSVDDDLCSPQQLLECLLALCLVGPGIVTYILTLGVQGPFSRTGTKRLRHSRHSGAHHHHLVSRWASRQKGKGEERRKAPSSVFSSAPSGDMAQTRGFRLTSQRSFATTTNGGTVNHHSVGMPSLEQRPKALSLLSTNRASPHVRGRIGRSRFMNVEEVNRKGKYANPNV